ncbi:MAG TPA: sialidase family protein [Bacteroidales bacterium]|nr:sialidase family protein [Bacteroidales bacterium]
MVRENKNICFFTDETLVRERIRFSDFSLIFLSKLAVLFRSKLLIIAFVLFGLSSFLLRAQTDSLYKATLIQDQLVFSHPPFASCHASTIAEVKKGVFLVSCFGGSYEGANDVGIWTSRLKGKAWESPIEVVSSRWKDTTVFPCWNPVLFQVAGKLMLFYKQGKNPREWWGMVMTSKNGGKTWSTPVQLPDGFLGPIKNKPVLLSDGKILCPSSIETTDNIWSSHVEITNTALTSWQKVFPDSAEEFGIIQPSILIHPEGNLQMLFRSREDYIIQSWSYDGGLHWSQPSKLHVPNPNSGIDAVTLSNGLHVLVYNPLFKGKDWFNGRNILKVAVSDDGIHWSDVYTLENNKDGEYSYPAIIQSSDSKVHITYTLNRKNIKHVVLNIQQSK